MRLCARDTPVRRRRSRRRRGEEEEKKKRRGGQLPVGEGHASGRLSHTVSGGLTGSASSGGAAVCRAGFRKSGEESRLFRIQKQILLPEKNFSFSTRQQSFSEVGLSANGITPCGHWAVLRFFALNPAAPPSRPSKGDEQVAASASDRPADSPLRYLDCGWSKGNWGRGLYSPESEGSLAAGERACVCENGLGASGACGWTKTACGGVYVRERVGVDAGEGAGRGGAWRGVCSGECACAAASGCACGLRS
ncbi:hypothetical protein EYF80_052665 [Liparis tanakae]|uniref:Uncharacterized protein n=1 Tax=Liparis tanakae TaxID=230148 RepID=A0A4Z2F9Y9_9TELE|nr:hypothetical protein EYF80_052665 [Liparis tanakae]